MLYCRLLDLMLRNQNKRMTKVRTKKKSWNVGMHLNVKLPKMHCQYDRKMMR